MIEPGTEKPKPEKRQSRRKPRGKRPEGAAAKPAEAAKSGKPAHAKPTHARRGKKPAGGRRGSRHEKPRERTGSFERRAKREVVPITKEMTEGKEAMRSFGDLLQFQKKKDEPTGDSEKK